MSRGKQVRETDKLLDQLGAGDAPHSSTMPPGPEKVLKQVAEDVDRDQPGGAR